MKHLGITIWAESLKVRKSRVFWISFMFFVFIAFMMGLMMFIQEHPELIEKLGLIGTKASMLNLGGSNWQSYFSLLIEILAGVGLIGFGFVTTWVFGREYTDHTLKDILALPVSRSSIVISKIIVVIAWSILLSAVFLVFSVLFGRMAGLSQWSTGYFAAFLYKYTMVTLLSILLCTPVAFFTCYSRGLLLPVGIIILTMIMANFSGLVGLGPYFPWSIPGLFGVYSTASGEHLNLVSYVILVMTSLAGFGGTLAWWQYADHK